MKNLTVIIQGPLSDIIYRKLYTYRKYGRILISTWEDVNRRIIPSDISIVSRKLPDKSKSLGTISNFYYAVCGMDNAMQEVKTEYFIRTRGDEHYENLDSFIEEFTKNKNKIICGNIFARKWEDRPLHIGDHIYISNTKLFRKVFKLLRNMYDKKIPLENWAIQGSIDFDPVKGIKRSTEAEVILAKAILYIKGIPMDSWYDKKNFLKYFEICDINKTKPFYASWQNGKKFYKNKFNNPHKVKTSADL